MLIPKDLCARALVNGSPWLGLGSASARLRSVTAVQIVPPPR
jgi:hypothetical protein